MALYLKYGKYEMLLFLLYATRFQLKHQKFELGEEVLDCLKVSLTKWDYLIFEPVTSHLISIPGKWLNIDPNFIGICHTIYLE